MKLRLKKNTQFIDQSKIQRTINKVEVFETGIKVIDLICPFIKGKRLVCSGSWCRGKTVVIMELIRNIAQEHSGKSVFAVGESQFREGNDLYHGNERLWCFEQKHP